MSEEDAELEALRSPGSGRTFSRIGGTALVAILGPALLLQWRANGPTALSFVLTLTLLAAALWAFFRFPSHGRKALLFRGAVGTGVLVLPLFAAVRLNTQPTRTSFRYVENGARDATPPLLSRVIDEHETVRAGLVFAGTLGLIEGAEQDSLRNLLEKAYVDSRFWPNAPLIHSTPRQVRYLLHLPPQQGPVPCLVFLHGFGGQLSAYVETLRTLVGDRYAIVAPFLDSSGAFWTPQGLSLVGDLLRSYLPREVDTHRLVLVGLSNGAIGASAILQSERLAPSFRGFILVSGIGETTGTLKGTNVLAIAGSKDPRFPLSYVETEREHLRQSGALVRSVNLNADHFLLLSHADELGPIFEEWLDTVNAPSKVP